MFLHKSNYYGTHNNTHNTNINVLLVKQWPSAVISLGARKVIMCYSLKINH